MDQKKDNALLGHKGVFKECLKQILFVEQFAEEMKLNEEAEYVSIVNAARKALRECRTTLKKAERLEGWRRGASAGLTSSRITASLCCSSRRASDAPPRDACAAAEDEHCLIDRSNQHEAPLHRKSRRDRGKNRAHLS